MTEKTKQLITDGICGSLFTLFLTFASPCVAENTKQLKLITITDKTSLEKKSIELRVGEIIYLGIFSWKTYSIFG